MTIKAKHLSIKKLLVDESELESEIDKCNKHLNEHKHTLDFINNEKDFNMYLNNEIEFFNTQYQRGIIKGIDKADMKNIQDVLKNDPDNQTIENVLNIDSKQEDIRSMDDFHLRVRNNLDKAAHLN